MATKWEGNPKTACFIFPEASGHINASLALSARLAKKRGWSVNYLSNQVMKECILSSGATFDDERDVAPELCEDRGDGRPGYFSAYERLRHDVLPDSKAWEGRCVSSDNCKNALLSIFMYCVLCSYYVMKEYDIY